MALAQIVMWINETEKGIKKKTKNRKNEKKRIQKINSYTYDQLIINKGGSIRKRKYFEQMILEQFHFGKVLQLLKKLLY